MTSYRHKENQFIIIYFYDVFIKLWTITKYSINKYGKREHQIGDSEYLNNKYELKKCYPQFKFSKEAQ